jgi:hypothetical protein
MSPSATPIMSSAARSSMSWSLMASIAPAAIQRWMVSGLGDGHS